MPGILTGRPSGMLLLVYSDCACSAQGLHSYLYRDSEHIILFPHRPRPSKYEDVHS